LDFGRAWMKRRANSRCCDGVDHTAVSWFPAVMPLAYAAATAIIAMQGGPQETGRLFATSCRCAGEAANLSHRCCIARGLPNVSEARGGAKQWASQQQPLCEGNEAMSRIYPVERNTNSKTQELFGAVEKKMGMVPNMISTMAHSPAVAQAYLGFSQSLAGGSLPASLREQISLVVGEANQCNYCVSAHCFLGSKAGLSESDLLDARHGMASDGSAHAALVFAQQIVDNRGHVSDEDVEEVRRAGYSDGEIAEIVANVALNIFTNYFNRVAETEIDFPLVPSLAAV
jgi:uncharacterized peroxidase-related enzyme